MSAGELLGDLGGKPFPLGLVLVAPDDLGGIAYLLGDVPQDGRFLLGSSRGVRGLQKLAEGVGQRRVVRGKAVESGVQRLGEGWYGSAPAAVAVFDGGLPAGGEGDGHVAGRGAGLEQVGEGAGDVVGGGCVGGRAISRSWAGQGRRGVAAAVTGLGGGSAEGTPLVRR